MSAIKDLLFAVIETALMPILRSLILVVPGLVMLMSLTARVACGCSTKEGAYSAAMRSDLRNLVTLQEEQREIGAKYGYFLDTSSVADFRWSHGVELVYMRRTATGFAAEVGYPSSTLNRCRADHVWGSEVVPTCDWTRHAARRRWRLFR